MKRQGRRISMKKIREVWRLRKKMGLGVNQIARACNISKSTASSYVKMVDEVGTEYEEVSSLDDESIYTLLFPKGGEESATAEAVPDFEYLTIELRRPGVTLQLLYEEYRRDNPDGYGRSQFYKTYRQYKKSLNPTMRFNHKAGDKMFVDFSGDRPHYIDPETGEVIEAELFVTVLGASSYTFAYALPNQKVGNFIKGHIKALEYYGGCPACIVPDNLKSGVTKACYYDPEVNRSFADMAEHYNLAVVPTRVRKPKDKAKVESGVLQVQRRILAALRNRTFFSLHELNEAIEEELGKLNGCSMKVIGKSRRELFEEVERAALRPLPAERFDLYAWKQSVKVHIDYHVEVERSYYSVPYTLIGKRVDIKYNTKVVEIFCSSRRVASHLRTDRVGRYITENNHMPHEHRQYLEWTPERIKRWGEKVGANTRMMMERIMSGKKYPEQGFRSCLGIIRLSKKYTPERLENACRRALMVEACSYRSIKSILDKGLDRVDYQSEEEASKPVEHQNIRGRTYYMEVKSDRGNC